MSLKEIGVEDGPLRFSFMSRSSFLKAKKGFKKKEKD